MKLPLLISTDYSIDELGNVYSGRNWRGSRDRILRPFSNEEGYMMVRLSIDGKRIKKSVHSLVLNAFRGPKPSPESQCRHLNGVKEDNRLENLAWGTAKENGEDKVFLGETARGENNGASKLTEIEVSIIKNLLHRGGSRAYIGALFDVSKTTIKEIEKGIIWPDVKMLADGTLNQICEEWKK